jgi:hypothetical protein
MDWYKRSDPLIFAKLTLVLISLWFLGNIIESETLQLRNIESNSLVFECVADNGIDEPLKKKVIISVSGKRSLHSLISFF